MTLGTQGCPVGEAPKHHNDDLVDEDDDGGEYVGDGEVDNDSPPEAP